jgi:hypothetical protein
MPGFSLTSLKESDFILYSERWKQTLHTLLVYAIQIIAIGQNYIKKDYEELTMKLLWVLAAISFFSAYGFVTNTKTYEVHEY